MLTKAYCCIEYVQVKASLVPKQLKKVSGCEKEQMSHVFSLPTNDNCLSYNFKACLPIVNTGKMRTPFSLRRPLSSGIHEMSSQRKNPGYWRGENRSKNKLQYGFLVNFSDCSKSNGFLSVL